MKSVARTSLILTLLLSALQLSSPALAAEGGNAGGGGNTLGGRMIESYIKDPRSLREYGLLLEKLKLLKAKNADLYHLFVKGVLSTTYYYIPADLKELSFEVTGLPFGSEQTALQNFATREVWIDDTSRARLVDDGERARLLAHEALLSGLNIIGSQISGDLNLEAIHKIGPRFDAAQLPNEKRQVRQIVSLLFNPRFPTMTAAQLGSELNLKGLNWVRGNGQAFCAKVTGKTSVFGGSWHGGGVYGYVNCRNVR